MCSSSSPLFIYSITHWFPYLFIYSSALSMNEFSWVGFGRLKREMGSAFLPSFKTNPLFFTLTANYLLADDSLIGFQQGRKACQSLFSQHSGLILANFLSCCAPTVWVVTTIFCSDTSMSGSPACLRLLSARGLDRGCAKLGQLWPSCCNRLLG